MPDQPLTDERLRDHAFEQAKAGDIIGARQTVSKMIDRKYLREAWIAILHNQMRLGDLQGVKEMIASFPDDSLWFCHSTFYFPLDFARAGDVPGARETACLIDSESWRSTILDGVSELQREGKIPEEPSQH
jgi:hypothetical protein